MKNPNWGVPLNYYLKDGYWYIGGTNTGVSATGTRGPKGDKGDPGLNGGQGEQGESAYTHALQNGFVGSVSDWLASLKGDQGPKGDTGAQGVPGVQGPCGGIGLTGAPGPKGDPGLNGAKGDPGVPGPRGVPGPQGIPGTQGAQGVQGLKGDKGDKGDTGEDAVITDGSITEQKLATEVQTKLNDKSASSVTITDTSNYFTSGNVEGVLSEVGVKVNELEGYIGYTSSDIYGVEVDVVNKTFTRLAGAIGRTAGADFNSINAFGGRKRCNITDGGVVTAYYGETAYTETGALLQQVIKNGVIYAVGHKVQVMVEQPRFYYKVVPLKLDKIEYKEINTITVTAIPTTNGNLTINLDGNPFTVAVLTTDNTTTLVANKIRATSFYGWTASGTGASVIFTSVASGERVTATFSGGTTGVTATVVKNVSGKASKGFHNRKARYYVSDTMKAGFKLHPAFIVNGVSKNFVYLSAYEGSLYDTSASAYILDDAQVADFTVTTGDKMCSIANAKPMSGLTQNLIRANTRKLAQNRGTGWQQAYAATVSASQLLMLIEYASFNMQSKIGNGAVSKVDDGTTNMSEPTGATTLLGNASGIAVNTNGIQFVSYRGEENFWGNIWGWVDGLNIYSYGEQSLYVADNSFADNVNTAPYKDAGFTGAKREGYVSAFGYSEGFDWLFYPSETFGDSNLPVGDYHWLNSQSNSWFVGVLGGGWDACSAAGAFYWYVYNASSHRYRYIGGRLVYVPSAVA